MINPIVPLSMRGAIWYQGESNVARAQQYAKLFPAMITDWRKKLGTGRLPLLVRATGTIPLRRQGPEGMC